MPDVKLTKEQRLYIALKRIASYQSPDRLRRGGDKEWGCSAEEAIEMAYENVLQEAKSALKGVRVKLPKVAA